MYIEIMMTSRFRRFFSVFLCALLFLNVQVGKKEMQNFFEMT